MNQEPLTQPLSNNKTSQRLTSVGAESQKDKSIPYVVASWAMIGMAVLFSILGPLIGIFFALALATIFGAHDQAMAELNDKTGEFTFTDVWTLIVNGFSGSGFFTFIGTAIALFAIFIKKIRSKKLYYALTANAIAWTLSFILFLISVGRL